MKRLTIIACCVVILGASYVFGAKTMTHTLEDIDAAITTFLTMDTAAELEALLSLQNLQGAVTDAQVPNDITINAENVSVADADENFTGTDAAAVLDELYDTKEPSQTPAGQAEMEAGTETAIRSMSPLRVAQAIATLATIEPLRLTLDGADGTLKALLDDVSATGDWFFASDNIIYTYSVTDPDNAYTEIKAFTDSEPDSVTPAEAVLQVGGDKTINIGGKRIDVR